jgi:hypothetical protein
MADRRRGYAPQTSGGHRILDRPLRVPARAAARRSLRLFAGGGGAADPAPALRAPALLLPRDVDEGEEAPHVDELPVAEVLDDRAADQEGPEVLDHLEGRKPAAGQPDVDDAAVVDGARVGGSAPR